MDYRKEHCRILSYTFPFSFLLSSPLLVFLKDQSCSRLIQTVFQFSHKALLQNTYKNHLKNQLMPLALHPFANYTVQSLIAASVDYKVVN